MSTTIQRWSAKRKAEIVIKLISHEINLHDFCAAQDITVETVQEWCKTFIRSGEQGLKGGNAPTKQVRYDLSAKGVDARLEQLTLSLSAMDDDIQQAG